MVTLFHLLLKELNDEMVSGWLYKLKVKAMKLWKLHITTLKVWQTAVFSNNLTDRLAGIGGWSRLGPVEISTFLTYFMNHGKIIEGYAI